MSHTEKGKAPGLSGVVAECSLWEILVYSGRKIVQ